jgi:hypothetical protein
MIRLTREEIYDMVWELPMTEIAKMYIISDVGFRKLCLRLEIPIPKCGDWAKVKAGYKLRKPKLSISWKGKAFAELEKRPSDQPVKKVSELNRLVKQVALEKLPFKVPERLTKPDILTIAAKESFSKLTDVNYPGMVATSKGQLDIRVAPSNTGRALRFMDTLIKCVRARGYFYEVNNYGNFVVIDNVKLRVNFREQTNKFRVHNKPYQDFEWRPNGKLAFRLDSRLKAEWRDLKTQSLEDQLPKVLAKLELAAKQEKEYLGKARLWQENWERQRRIQAEREIGQRQEQKEFHELMIKAKRWKQAQLLREYLTAIPNVDHKWFSWANHKADWLDPITNAYDEWLTEKDLETVDAI